MGPGSGPSSTVERENAGLRTELEPFWAWNCGSPELPGRVWLALWPAANPGRCRTLRSGWAGRGRRWTGWNKKKKWKMMVFGKATNLKWWCSGPDFLVICENYMLRNGNLGLKMGVSRAVHSNMHAYGSTPPPPVNPLSLTVLSLPLFLHLSSSFFPSLSLSLISTFQHFVLKVVWHIFKYHRGRCLEKK